MTARGNAYGVYFDTQSDGGTHRIGGAAAGDRNLFGGNREAGIYLHNAPAAVLGNLIGTDRTGARAVPNGTGVRL